MTSSALPSQSSRRVLLGLALGVPVSLLFLWLAVRSADLGAVRDTLGDASPGRVALAVVAIFALYGFQAVRWRLIAGSPHVRLARFYEMIVSALACNNVLPARLGDLLKARWLGREAPMPAGRALGTVVLDRGCDVAALLAFLALGLAAVATSEWLVHIAVAATALLAGLGAVLVFARFYIRRRARDRRERRLLRRVLRDMFEMLAEPLGRRRLAGWIALSLCGWGMWALAAILAAEALGLELALVEAMFVAAVMNLGSAIPSSPGVVGTYEWLGVASLGLLDVPAEEALAFAILLHASWYVPTTLAGGAALGARALLRLRRTRTARSTAQAPEEPVGR
jgi:uncharacterized protein (TIRG00374 family)